MCCISCARGLAVQVRVVIRNTYQIACCIAIMAAKSLMVMGDSKMQDVKPVKTGITQKKIIESVHSMK